MPRKPPTPKPSTTRRTGPSADAKAGKAAVKRKVASKATDAVSRRYVASAGPSELVTTKNVIKDKVTGITRTRNRDDKGSKRGEYRYSASNAKTAAKYKSEKNMKKNFGK